MPLVSFPRPWDTDPLSRRHDTLDDLHALLRHRGWSTGWTRGVRLWYVLADRDGVEIRGSGRTLTRAYLACLRAALQAEGLAARGPSA